MGTNAQDIRRDLLAFEERFWLEGGGDPEFWGRHFAEDGLVALPFGIMDKSQTLEAMDQGEPWARVDMDDVRVVQVTDGSALVSYSASAAREHDADDYRAVVGSLYVYREGSWYLLFHQQSIAAS